MNSRDRIRYDMFVSVDEFGKTNTADFPAGSVAAIQFAEIAAVITLIQQLIGTQASSRDDARFSFNNKFTARENLREELSVISQTARSMVYQNPGIDLKFRMPSGGSDANLLASARAFYENSTEYNAAMIEYGLDANFRQDLSDAITAFEQSLNAPNAATGSQVTATADIGETVRRGMVAVRILDGVVRNKYRDNAGKLAAWTSASHIERTSPKTAPIPPAA